MNRIYLDHCATTPLAPEVFEAMQPFLTHGFGNASSIHSFGRDAKVALDAARETVAQFLGVLPQEIVFTSGGTEANNFALFGAAAGFAAPGHIVTSRIEHPCVLYACKELERRGWKVAYVEPDAAGMISAEAVRRALRPETVLLSIMHANNETGTINPIREIAQLAAERGMLFHTDAVQTFAKTALDLRALPLALVALSGHKIYGPKGVGVLFVRRGVKLNAFLHGGKQERERRPGTENIPAIAGLAKAVILPPVRGWALSSLLVVACGDPGFGTLRPAASGRDVCGPGSCGRPRGAARDRGDARGVRPWILARGPRVRADG